MKTRVRLSICNEAMRILVGYTDIGTFDPTGHDVQVVREGRPGRPPASIAEMLERCPTGWKPDIYYHPGLIFFPVPSDIEEFDGLTAALVSDWHRGGRALWSTAGLFDVIVAERNACALLEASGYRNAVFARIWGYDPEVHRYRSDTERDIDVLFVGHLNSSAWEDRNRWIDRIGRMSSEFKVVIETGCFGDRYIELLNRAKIVFNRSVRGETNIRAYEGLACGALVFNEDTNEETREIFVDQEHCIYYNVGNLEALIGFYATHEEERARIAEAGRRVVIGGHSNRSHTDAVLAMLEANVGKRGYRPLARLPVADRSLRKVLQMYASGPALFPEARDAMIDRAESAGVPRARTLQARAALRGWYASHLADARKVAGLSEAISFAREGGRFAPASAVGRMSTGYVLLERGEATNGAPPTTRNDMSDVIVFLSEAAEAAEAAIATLAEHPRNDVAPPLELTEPLEGLTYPHTGDRFDIYVERAYLVRTIDAWDWATAMWTAIGWKCRSTLSILARINDQKEEAWRQASAAHALMPTDGESLIRLARVETETGRLAVAASHYAAGIVLLPFEWSAWLEYTALLVALGERATAETFVQERLQVIRAAAFLKELREPLMRALAG